MDSRKETMFSFIFSFDFLASIFCGYAIYLFPIMSMLCLGCYMIYIFIHDCYRYIEELARQKEIDKKVETDLIDIAGVFLVGIVGVVALIALEKTIERPRGEPLPEPE